VISKQWRLIGAFCVVLLNACGGGGSDDSTIVLDFDGERVDATFFEHQEMYVNAQSDPDVTIALSADGEVSGPIYVQVVDNNQAFVGESAAITDQGDGRFTATLRANSDLPPGIYAGSLTVNICKDVTCASKYKVTGNTLPYTITIVPQMSLKIYVDGVEVAAATSSSDVIQLPYTPRTSIEIVSNTPAEISAQDHPGSYTFDIDPGSTSQDWMAQIDTSSGLLPGAFVYVKAADGTGDAQKEVAVYFSFNSF